MVSVLEARLVVGGLLAFYAFTAVDVLYKKFKRNKDTHRLMVESAGKAVNDMNMKDFKFIETSNKKLIFILGIENNIHDYEKLKLLDDIFLNFRPGTVFFERHPEICSNFLTRYYKTIEKEFKFGDDHKSIDEAVDNTLKEREQELKAMNDKQRQRLMTEEIRTMEIEKGLKNIIPGLLDKAKSGQDKEAFEKLAQEKDFFFNFVNSTADILCKRNGKECKSVYAGVDYGIIKSYVKKKIILGDDFQGEDSMSLEDLKKMTLNERLSLKNEQAKKNLNSNIYDDIKTYIKTEIEAMNSSGRKFEVNVNNFYDQIVIKDVNNILINNIVSDKKAYVGLLIVNSERMEQLYEQLSESKAAMNKL